MSEKIKEKIYEYKFDNFKVVQLYKNGHYETEIVYENDKLCNGPYNFKKNNRLLFKGSYRNGKRNGVWRKYDKKGQVILEIVYKNGYIDWTEHDERFLSENFDHESDDYNQEQYYEEEGIYQMGLDLEKMEKEETERYLSWNWSVNPKNFFDEEGPSDD